MSNINEKNLGPRWYVAHTYTGYENKVKRKSWRTAVSVT